MERKRRAVFICLQIYTSVTAWCRILMPLSCYSKATDSDKTKGGSNMLNRGFCFLLCAALLAVLSACG
ncbi:hypothetical protein, partial [Allofournierella massiliensis]|uniref:hypothetical protein n=1 Tax=Allofournierella massiliensis TaxID=1650663 RepID=UPI0025A3D27E